MSQNVGRAHQLRQEATRQGKPELAQKLSKAITAYEDQKLQALPFRSLLNDAERELST